jgi:DMSO/TMAO reductase YedYZ molybdopterin-dependent catalytic subunit
MAKLVLSRRGFLRGAAIAGSGAALAGCEQFDFLRDRDNGLRNALESTNQLTYQAQRLILGDETLAPEYSDSEIRQGQRPNGTRNPTSSEYRSLRDNDFADYRLRVTGLVEHELSYSLDEIRNMLSRTQITRHDCVEGWSCIAKWTGTPLRGLVDEAVPTAAARYLVFHCFDTYGNSGALYYESCDLVDARHPQTILAYAVNDEVLPVANGAPIRVRIERQLGYKQPKYLHTIEVVSSFAHIYDGKGGYWEDRGYEWYAGI